MDAPKVLASTTDAAFASDEAGRIVAWNAPARDLLGFEAGQVIGKSCAEILDGRDVRGRRLCREGCPVLSALQRHEPVRSTVMDVKQASGKRLRARVSMLMLRNARPGWTAVHVVQPATDSDPVGELGEREVTVLFTDIRGYSRYAESRQAKEVFSLVNRYAELVAEIVERQGGKVVEFSGDGMMSVFGALEALPDKERAAVHAAREIVANVGRLDQNGGQPLAVGAGVATGVAFVGGLQALHASTWSAVGRTTNRAARLQMLSRDLEASVVIDAATWERLGPERKGFQRRANARLRGSKTAQDVYTLPLAR